MFMRVFTSRDSETERALCKRTYPGRPCQVKGFLAAPDGRAALSQAIHKNALGLISGYGFHITSVRFVVEMNRPSHLFLEKSL